ncbi:hypothetical protein RCL1_003787 [Eukaryota sp. TZLM3-RCL]
MRPPPKKKKRTEDEAPKTKPKKLTAAEKAQKRSSLINQLSTSSLSSDQLQQLHSSRNLNRRELFAPPEKPFIPILREEQELPDTPAPSASKPTLLPPSSTTPHPPPTDFEPNNEPLDTFVVKTSTREDVSDSDSEENPAQPSLSPAFPFFYSQHFSN